MNIGVIIKELSEKKKIKVSEIAANLGVTGSRVYQIFESESIQVDQLIKLAKLFNVKLNIFFKDNKELFEDYPCEDVEWYKNQIEEKDKTIAFLRDQLKSMQEKFEQFHDKTKKEKAGSE